MRPTLEEQIEAGLRLMGYVGDEYDAADRAALEALWQTLRWMRANKATLHMAAALMRDDAVQKVMDAFPEAEPVRATKI